MPREVNVVVLGSPFGSSSSLIEEPSVQTNLKVIDGKKVELVITDILRTAKLTTAGIQILQNANTFVITYSTGSQNSFQDIPYLIKQMEWAQERACAKIPIVIVALIHEQPVVPRGSGIELASSLSCPFFEISSTVRQWYHSNFEPIESATRVYFQKKKGGKKKVIKHSQNEMRHSTSAVFNWPKTQNKLFLSTDNIQKQQKRNSFNANDKPDTQGITISTQRRMTRSASADSITCKTTNTETETEIIITPSLTTESVDIAEDRNENEKQQNIQDNTMQEIIESTTREEMLLTISPAQTFANASDINEIQNTLITQIRNIHEQQENLKAQIAELSDTKEKEREELEARLRVIEQQERDAMITREIKVAKYAAQNRFRKNTNLWVFYRTVNIKLEEIFVGCKAIASSLIETDVMGTMGKVAKGISLVGKVFKIVPVVGPIASSVISGAAKAVEYIDHIQQTSIICNISLLGTLGELQKLAEYVARRLTEKYTDQICLLSSSNEATTFGKIVAEITKREKTPVQLVAEYGVAKILNYLQSTKFENLNIDSISAQMLATLAQPTKAFSDKILSTLGLESFPNVESQIWCFSDFYSKPGRIINGKKYTASCLLPELYGYCLSSEDEIQQLQLVPDISFVEIEEPYVRSESPANMRRIKDISDQQISISSKQEYYAEITRRTKEKNDDTTKKLEELKLTVQKLESRIAMGDK